MRIYKVTYEVDLYLDGKLFDTEENVEKIAGNSMGEAIAKLMPYAKKTYHGFKPYREREEEDGKKRYFTYQHKNLSVKSCELLQESTI